MSKYTNPLLLIILLTLTIFMIINPRETVTAATDGFNLWYSVIIPAILPFFIVSELLVSLGFVRLLGFILEPITRSLFRLPGASSLVIAMGFTSGFPVGAVLSKRLYDEKMLTAEETERLVSFTNNSSPLFIIGALGVGMFNRPEYGYLLAISHYGSNLLVGLIWRCRGSKARSCSYNSWKDILPEMLTSNYQGAGQLLGNAVKNSLNNILAIAGFIIFFSVLGRMLAVWGGLDLLACLLVKILACFNISYPIAYGMGMGLFEITIGAKTVTAAGGAILPQLLAVSILLGFSGFSIIAQVMSVVADTPARLSFYLLSRLVQTSLSVLITYWGYKVFLLNAPDIPVLAIPFYKVLYAFDSWAISFYCMSACMIILLGMIIIRFIVSD